MKNEKKLSAPLTLGDIVPTSILRAGLDDVNEVKEGAWQEISVGEHDCAIVVVVQMEGRNKPDPDKMMLVRRIIASVHLCANMPVEWLEKHSAIIPSKEILEK